MKKTEKKIVQWIKEKIKSTGAKGLIFGLSGGIDSAVVAALCEKAAGKNHIALMLPCQSSKLSITDAMALVRKLGLRAKKIDLTPIYDCALKTLGKANELAKANLKARLRMITLYYHANNFNYLVVGTGNLSEFVMGYFTKYGDGGVDILPIADLLKSQVRDLAKSLGIPNAIIEKAPTADLWAGQTDEQEMGLTYEQLDKTISFLKKGGKCSVPKGIINKVKKMIKNSEHKRIMPQICKINI
ncbi:MAG: NAD(+) synthase [Candidatus Omnitrophica bacterium]|nr:NAD(+) synthase [Candidatus Omnitrophota bacterium]